MAYHDVATLDRASSRVLCRIQTVFPFKIFPDVIEVTDTEVQIIYGIFFWAKQIQHMPIKELHNVSITTGLLYSTLIFEIKGYEKNPQQVSFLPTKQALEAQSIISGLILAGLDDINTLQYPRTEVQSHLRSIGEAETVNI